MTLKGRTMLSSGPLGAELPRRQPVTRDDSAFRILIIGDLGARSAFHIPISVDRDDLDQVMERLQVSTRLQLREGDPSVEIAFREFDDFHPDQLFARVSLFESLRTRRSRLQNDATSREEIAAILKAGAGDVDRPKPAPVQNQADLLSSVLNFTEAAQKPLEQQVFEGRVDWDAYVQQLVAPHLVAKADPRQSEMLAAVDAAITSTMQSVLHHPAYQRLEAAWQGIRFLTRRLETDRTLQLSVMHVSPAELAADVLSGDDLTQTKLYRTLVDDISNEDEDPCSLIVGDFQFGNSSVACEVLARTATICEAAGTLFVSGAAPEIAGCPGFAKTTDPRQWPAVDNDSAVRWQQLRGLNSADNVVLALPRILARRPYGADSDPIESFGFTELGDGTQRSQYLWMNAAYGIANLMGQAFSRSGWDYADSLADEIDRLPQHVFSLNGQDVVQPATEEALTEAAAEKFARCGLTVLRAVRNDDVVRVATVRRLGPN